MKKRLTIWYRRNGEDHELVREIPEEWDEAGVLLDILEHERRRVPSGDVPYSASTLERRRSQLRDQGITGEAWKHENIE